MSSFDEWFKRATENDPFPYQRRFAEEGEIPELVAVPTGLGKTAMAVLGWLWRRRFANEETRKATSRRLVYCLPMRVLVEQTVAEAKKWLAEIKKQYPKVGGKGSRPLSFCPADMRASRGAEKRSLKSPVVEEEAVP